MTDLIRIRSWWYALSPRWQGLLLQAIECAGSPNDSELLRIVALKFLFMYVPSEHGEEEDDSEMFEIDDLAPLQLLTELESLTVQGLVDGVSSLESLRQCGKLKTLFINGTSISDLSPLQSLAQLDYLTINHTKVSDFSPLAGMPVLKRVMAVDSIIRSLAPLTNMRSLEMLDVRSEYLPEIDVAELKRLNPHVRFNFMLEQMALAQQMNEMDEVSDELLREMEEMRDFFDGQLENYILRQAGIVNVEGKEFMLEVDEVPYLVNFDCVEGVVRLNRISCPDWVFVVS